MGFFDSIKTGLGAAVNHVSQNSGTILGVAGAIAKVADTIPAVQDAGDNDAFLTGDPVVDLQASYNRATSNLMYKAQKTHDANVKALEVLTAGDSGFTIQKEILSGIWKFPTILDAQGQPPVPQYQDIAKFLHQSNMPLIFQSRSGIRDVARDISLAIFSNQNDGGLLISTDENGINTVLFKFMDDGASCVVSGCHAYYDLPMGQALAESCWHSAVYIQVLSNDDFRKEHLIFKKSLAHSAVIPQGTKDVWLVTLRVAWTSVPLAVKAWPLIKDYFTGHMGNYNIIYHALAGVIDVIKIQAPPDVTPAQVKTALTQAAADAIQRMSSPVMLTAMALENNVAYQLPTITITSTSIVTGGN